MPDTITFDEAQSQPDTFSFEDVSSKDTGPESPSPLDVPKDPTEVAIQNWKRAGMFEENRPLPATATLPGGTEMTLPVGVQLPTFRAPPEAGPIEKVATGAYNVAASIPNFIMSPAGIATAIVPEILPARIAAPVLKGLFGGLLAKSAGEAAGTASVTKDPQDITEAALSTALVPLPFAARLLPKSTQQASQTITEKGLPDASKIGETKTVHESLSSQPIESVREMPAQERGEGVQPQAPKVQAEQARVLLTPEETEALAKSNRGEDLTGHEEELVKTAGSKGERSESKSGELQMAIVPGAKEFFEQDVIPKTVAGAKAIADSAKGTEALLSPPTVSEPARLASGIVREKAAELAQKDYQSRKEFAKARSAMASWKPQESLQFIHKVETGQTSSLSPEMQQVADGFRQALNERVRQVRALGTGKLQTVIQDYFPHIWKEPNKASQMIAKIFGKRPLEGPKSFLKKRTIPLTMDGVAVGLEPVTWNPVDLTLLKLHEMDRYVMGQKVMQEYKAKGLAQFSRSDVPPEGYAKINDSVGNVIEYRPTKTASGAPGAPERVLRGHWFAQEDAARVLNNYLSPGLGKFAWYRALRWFGNNLNMANLGLSGYHLTFTMIDSGTSKLSLGIEQAAQGRIKGAVTAARGVAGTLAANQLEAYYKGSKVLKEYSKPGSVGGEYTKVVDALLAGGGRVEMPQIFQNSTLRNFFDAIKSGNYPGAILRAPFAAIHAVSYPLMNVVVPRLKLGIFNDMARHEIERMGPNVTREQFRKTMGGVWDSVDNRMGELVYDNLFWNKTLKDLSFLAVRSVGWNLGTVRELGGAVVDSATIIKRIKKGDLAVTRKMAYAVALPITVGMMGAVYQKLRTGQSPQEPKDYFYPKTGNTLPNGEPERVNFPSYLKDVASVKRHPVQTVINKAHPSIGLISSMLQNKDYYGTEIVHPDDPIVQRAQDELKFIAKSFRPYSAQGAQKRTEIEPGIEPAVESFFGIMPLPAELTRTPAENLAIVLLRDQMPKGSRTKEQADRSNLERQAIGQMKMGKMSVADAIKQGLVSEQRAEAVEQRAMMPYLEYAVSRLNAVSAMKVFEQATPKEREIIQDRIDSKIDNATSLTEDQRDALRDRFNKLIK